MSYRDASSVSTIYQGDALCTLSTLPAESVHCVVTSPPYWGLRNYDVDGQIGLESSVDCGWYTIPTAYKHVLERQGIGPCGMCYICRLLAVFREVRRVLRKDGVVWVNLGDSYAASATSNHARGKNTRAENPPRMKPSGFLKPKDLVGGPWRFALAMQAEGWTLRSDTIWHKPNPMPSSAKDRPTVAHEYLFLLTKSRRYYWDAAAMEEPTASKSHGVRPQHPQALSFARHVAEPERPGQLAKQHRPGRQKVPSGWDTGVGTHGNIHRTGRIAPEYNEGSAETRNRRSVWTVTPARFSGSHFATFPPALIKPCIEAGSPRGGVVLDPFVGSGTTGLVAHRLGRSFVGIDLNPGYCTTTKRRIERDTGLFGRVEIVVVEKTTQGVIA